MPKLSCGHLDGACCNRTRNDRVKSCGCKTAGKVNTKYSTVHHERDHMMARHKGEGPRQPTSDRSRDLTDRWLCTSTNAVAECLQETTPLSWKNPAKVVGRPGFCQRLDVRSLDSHDTFDLYPHQRVSLPKRCWFQTRMSHLVLLPARSDGICSRAS